MNDLIILIFHTIITSAWNKHILGKCSVVFTVQRMSTVCCNEVIRLGGVLHDVADRLSRGTLTCCSASHTAQACRTVHRVKHDPIIVDRLLNIALSTLDSL